MKKYGMLFGSEKEKSEWLKAIQTAIASLTTEPLSEYLSFTLNSLYLFILSLLTSFLLLPSILSPFLFSSLFLFFMLTLHTLTHAGIIFPITHSFSSKGKLLTATATPPTL